MVLKIMGIADVNINCVDIALSKEFYSRLGIDETVDTLSPVQKGDGFGLAGSVQCLSHRMQCVAGKNATALEMIQWVQPPAWGDAPKKPNQLGYARLAIYVSNLDRLYQELTKQNVDALSELYCDAPSGLRWCYCRDPNGALIELVERQGNTELGYIVLNCVDLANSVAWYHVLFDLEPGPVQRLGVAPQLLDGNKPGEVLSVQMNMLEGMHNRFGLVLQQWQQPEATGQAVKNANHTGIYRLSYLVEDVQKSYDYLCSEGIACEALPFEWQTGADSENRWSLIVRDPTGACVELRQAEGL